MKKDWDNTRTDIIDVNKRDDTARSLSNLDHIVDQRLLNASKIARPDITLAREALPTIPKDKVFEIEHDDGTTDTGTASEIMARADEESRNKD